jgi:hypothetical protein
MRGVRDEHLLPHVSQRLLVRRRRALGLDGLKAGALVLLLFVAAACDSGGRPKELLYGGKASEFRPVRGSVIAVGRVLRRAALGRRLDDCLLRGDRATVARDALVAERVGVDGESLTFANRNRTGVYACDGGVDPAGERRLPWCGAVFGELEDGHLLDPRLDINCRDRKGKPLAYAFVQPVAGAHWIGVEQDGYVEIYEAMAALPVRIASTRGVSTHEASATFEVTQYDVEGRELVRSRLEAAVAG